MIYIRVEFVVNLSLHISQHQVVQNIWFVSKSIPIYIHMCVYGIWPLTSSSVWGKESEVAQLCPTLCDPMDCGLPGSSVHGIFQAKILEWDAMPSSRGSSQPWDWTYISCVSCQYWQVDSLSLAPLGKPFGARIEHYTWLWSKITFKEIHCEMGRKI